MEAPRLDLLAVGNAIVDVIAPASDAQVAAAGLVKGSMRLVCEDEALAIHAAMEAGASGRVQEISGGSAANSAAGVAALGGKVGFVGLLGPDRLGDLFRGDMVAAGVAYRAPVDAAGTATARCLIMVTDDAQRSMCTFPGAAHLLSVADIDEAEVAGAAILYLEGYLWDSPSARAAMEHAIRVARDAGRKVAVTPSDIACVQRCGDAFRGLIAAGQVDMLFLNEAELAELGQGEDEIARQVGLLVVTRGEKGATAVRGGERVSAPAAPAGQVGDTTGAGDLFAAGFLYGHSHGAPLSECLRIGAVAAGEVISHFGARPVADLRALI